MDATQALTLIIIAVIVRDGLLGWALINWVIRASTPATPVVPGVPTDPGTPPVVVHPPIVVPPPASPSPRFKGMATSFGGPSDPEESAYGGMVNGNALGVSLPARVSGSPIVRVFWNSKTADCPVVDVGPHFTTDNYWVTGAAPKAQSLTGQNKAIIDLTPATWAALGATGNLDLVEEDGVSWDFVSVLDATSPSPAPTTPTPTPAPTGTPPWLTLARSLVGVNEVDNPSQIVSWSKAIAAKFPDMTAYSQNYNSASIPWCGQFVAYVLAMQGIRPIFGPTDTDKYLWAPAWDDYGTDVGVAGQPQPGDILRFKWSTGGEHVTIYDHEVDDNYYHCTGGNQGDPGQVSTAAMAMSSCVAIRRPPSA